MEVVAVILINQVHMSQLTVDLAAEAVLDLGHQPQYLRELVLLDRVMTVDQRITFLLLTLPTLAVAGVDTLLPAAVDLPAALVVLAMT